MIRAGRFSAQIFTVPALGYRVIEDGKGCVGMVYLPESSTRKQANKDAAADVAARNKACNVSPQTGR